MEHSIEGKVNKLIGGFFYVETKNFGVVECRAMGKVKYNEQSPKVGDFVKLKYDDKTNKGYISSIINRRNTLTRPPVSNIDIGFIFAPVTEPDFNIFLVEKYIFTLKSNQITPVIIISKCDLASQEQINDLAKYIDYFAKINIAAFQVNSLSDDLHVIINNYKNKIIVLTGQTGAGKTTFLNHFGYFENTQSISKALGRGKHTTRQSSIYHLSNTTIIDTPGFSSFSVQVDNSLEVAQLMAQISQSDKSCKFRNCLHENEPGCAINDDQTLPKWHYDTYLKILSEVKTNGKIK